MKLWGGESDTGCCSVADVDDARRVAQQLGIDHHVFNFGDDFDDPRRRALRRRPRRRAHAQPVHRVQPPPQVRPPAAPGRRSSASTPSPPATTPGSSPAPTGAPWRLARGADRAKDQSYVLHMLDQASLAPRPASRSATMTKAEVRALAARARAAHRGASPTARTCASSPRRPAAGGFLGDRLPLTAGGRRRHRRAGGRQGRRRRAGHGRPAARRHGWPTPRRRTTERTLRGRRRRAQRRRHRRSAGRAPGPDGLARRRWRGSTSRSPARPQDVLVQVSAHGQPRPATVDASGVVTWTEPQRRVAPGQAVVLYDPTDTYVLGGGVAVAGPGTG